MYKHLINNKVFVFPVFYDISIFLNELLVFLNCNILLRYLLCVTCVRYLKIEILQKMKFKH